MSTLLSLAVVAVAIVAVVRIVLRDPEQPATLRPRTRIRNPVPASRVAISAQPAEVRAITVPERAKAGARRSPRRSRARSIWARVRSGMVLMLLVAVVGAMLALAVAAVLVGGALALRGAVS